MCKLFAYVNHEDKAIPHYMGLKINKALRQLFYINSYGQVDGSGIMWMGKTGVTNYLKAPIPSPTFMEMKSFDAIKDDLYSNKFVAGHTRYSTVGSNTWENSHPFEYGPYIGIQNGTISNSHKGLVLGKTSPCNVDSASVFWAFDQQGVDSTLDRYEGEGVFMFLDKEQKTFNVVKNNYRTLYKAKIDKLDAYILATDKFALEFVFERSGLVIEEVISIKNDTLITYGSDNTITCTDREVPSPVYKGYYSNYGNSGYNYGKSYQGYNKGSNMGGKAKSTTTVKTSGFVSKSKIGANKEIIVLEDFDVPDPVEKQSTHTLHGSEYLIDCDICMNPINTSSMMFADDPDPLKAMHIACSCCEAELKEYTGQPIYKITDVTGLSK